MIRYEATLEGSTEPGEPYTNFNEVQVFREIMEELGWKPELETFGLGGYYLFKVNINETEIALHVYLKRVTFGGREGRPYEKRAQFSASMDRRGFYAEENSNNKRLILAIYKREAFDETIICAWNINDWGYNEGRAFNCFVDINDIAKAFTEGFHKSESSAGQITYSFKPEYLYYYLNNKTLLDKGVIPPYEMYQKQELEHQDDLPEIPRFDNMFQLVMDILHDFDGTIDVTRMEQEAAEKLNLSSAARNRIHNLREGYRTELGYRLAWARFYLKKAGYVESPKRSLWNLTEKGLFNPIINREEIIGIATEREAKEEIEKEQVSNIQGENSDGIEEEYEIEVDDSYIETPFDPGQVDIKTRSMSLDLILKRLKRGEVDLNTSFQRKAGLWDNTKQSRLIESILIRFPLPAFYFDGTNDDKWLIVDGLQRLSSLDNFVNKGTLQLSNLEFLTQFNGKKFAELPGGLQRRIEEFETTAYIIAPRTPKILKYIVFRRINTGGLTLTPQEIRNALNQGRPAELVKKLADLRSFKQATAFSIPEDRMLDREFTTRFLAFYLFMDDYKTDLDGFLNSAMEKISLYTESETEEILSRFDNAMKTAFGLFGDDAFRKRYKLRERRKPINKALFDAWSVALSRLNQDEQGILTGKKDLLRQRFMNLLNTDDDFNLAISSSTGDKSRIRKRFTSIENLIQTTIYDQKDFDTELQVT